MENLVGVEGDAFKQTMVQLQHERGGIDRLVSNRALYEIALERADRDDPRIRQEIAVMTGSNEETIKSRIRYACGHLRRILEVQYAE